MSITLNGEQLKLLTDFVVPDETEDQMETEVTIEYRESPPSGLEIGYYAHITEYPEEGSIYLGA